jgi:stearoyl-CoA 9-desaturase NADPH oxidoreductase
MTTVPSRRGIVRRALASRFVGALIAPHSVDRYLEHINPALTVHEVRGRVVDVIHETGMASTVVLEPNDAWLGFRPGQHVQFGVEVEGKRRIRCFSVSSSTGRLDRRITVTVKAHDDGYVSQFLQRSLRPGTIVHLSTAEGEFVLPAVVPDQLLLLSGGSGITPVMSMLRSLRDAGHRGQVTFLHYARTADDEIFRTELDQLAGLDWVTMARVYTREPHDRSLKGRFTGDHLDELGVDPSNTMTYACGPAGLIETVRKTFAAAGAEHRLIVEYFKVPTVQLDAADATGTVLLDESGLELLNDGRPILEQIEDAGLTPAFGCRMGICHTCTVRKKYGASRNVLSGEVRADTDEDVQICVNAPVGDICLAL